MGANTVNAISEKDTVKNFLYHRRIFSGYSLSQRHCTDTNVVQRTAVDCERVCVYMIRLADHVWRTGIIWACNTCCAPNQHRRQQLLRPKHQLRQWLTSGIVRFLSLHDSNASANNFQTWKTFHTQTDFVSFTFKSGKLFTTFVWSINDFLRSQQPEHAITDASLQRTRLLIEKWNPKGLLKAYFIAYTRSSIKRIKISTTLNKPTYTTLKQANHRASNRWRNKKGTR